MKKPNWDKIHNMAVQILSQRIHKGDSCFLTVYQLANIMNDQDHTLKGDLPVGGKGEGSKTSDSLVWHVSQCLAKHKNTFEQRWFCIDRLDSFTIDNIQPSDNNFSMFRLIDNK